MSMWKRKLLAPNVNTIPDWVPRPPNGTDAFKPGKDVVPVTATAKNGGWNGGTWMPAGIGYGVRNHGWGERAAAAWYEARGYQSNAAYRVNPCTNSTETSYLLAAFLTALAVLSFRYVQTRFKPFYGLGVGLAACDAAALIIKRSGMTNSVDIAYVFECLSVALFPFLWAELSSIIYPPRDGLPRYSWNWITLCLSLSITAVLGAIDGVNFIAFFLIPLVEQAVLFGNPMLLLIRHNVSEAHDNSSSLIDEEQAPSSGEGERELRPPVRYEEALGIYRVGLTLPQMVKLILGDWGSESSMSYCIRPPLYPYLIDIISLFVFCFKTYRQRFEQLGPTFQPKLGQEATTKNMELHSPTPSVDAGDQNCTPVLMHEDKERS